MKMKWFLPMAVALALSATGVAVHAQSASTNTISLDDNFTPGWHEGTAGFGIMWSPIGSSFDRPPVDYVMGYVQAGYMLSHIHGHGLLRNNYEAVIEAFGAGIYQNTGHYIAGTTLWLRHNILPEGSKLTPYFEVGLGFANMDIDHKYDGHNFNFNLDAAVGAHYFIKPNVALNAEFMYQHISNANTGSHNIGINAVGPMFGLSWFF